MNCPKCELGEIKKVLFKKPERMAFLCEYCGTVWGEKENVNASTGHMIQTQTQDDEFEYSFIDIDEKNEDSKSVLYPKFK